MPLSSTGPISRKVTADPTDASTTSWLTSTWPGRAQSAIRDARLAQLGDVDTGPLGGLDERGCRHAPYCNEARLPDKDIHDQRLEVHRP